LIRVLNLIPVVSFIVLCLGLSGPTPADDSAQRVALPLPFLPTQLGSPEDLPPNTVLPVFPRETKQQWAQLFMLFNPLSVRDLLNVMAHKMPARPGLSVDQVVEALIARARKHGFLLVNRYQMWKELEAITGEKNTPKVEVVSICDPKVSRDWLDYAPEMALFVPPRIAVLEDRDNQVWLMMLDWDMHWLDTSSRAAFDPKLRAQGIERREMLEDIMRAAANGEKSAP
jgi:uncharacterized protein (DUF302 family)